MKISGFTIARNIVKYHYPFIESIQSILSICDEFVINVGDSEDETLEIIRSLGDPKIRIIQNTWDMSQGKEVLSYQTNLAMKECAGDWGFYLQADEVIHDDDLIPLMQCMTKYLKDPTVDALRFRWLHFYGSYYRYRVDSGWYQKQDRIIRLNGQMESYGDAYAFKRKDDRPLQVKNTGCLLYHYGWVQPQEVMAQRRLNAAQIGFVQLTDSERQSQYQYGDLDRFPVYFGTHPEVMRAKVVEHRLSREDWEYIRHRFWWHPALIFRLRYKTPKRVKHKIE